MNTVVNLNGAFIFSHSEIGSQAHLDRVDTYRSRIHFDGSVGRKLFNFGSTAQLLNYFISPREKLRRERQANLFRSFQVDDELKLRRLLHR